MSNTDEQSPVPFRKEEEVNVDVVDVDVDDVSAPAPTPAPAPAPAAITQSIPVSSTATTHARADSSASATGSALSLEYSSADQPGHLNNLSPEQSLMLRRFWAAILAYLNEDDEYLEQDGLSEVFEIMNTPVAEPASSTASGTVTPSNPSEDSTFSQKRGTFSFFSRKTSQEQLKSPCRCISRDELRRTFWHTIRTDHPDTLLLRFLRARKWDITKSLSMFIAALRWHFTQDTDRIIREGESGIPVNQFANGKTLVRGADKKGRPVIYIRARYHFKDAQTFETNRVFTIFVMETVRIMLAPPVETATMVFDLRDLTLANSDLGTIKFLVTCFEAFYPESLGQALIVGAPWIFWGLWKAISPLLDPVVASKIRILKKDTELLEYISPDQLISSLGGEDDRPYVYIPSSPEDDRRLEDTAEREARLEAVTEVQGRFAEASVDWDGAQEGPSFLRRQELAKEMRERTLALDPYVRSRTNLHRLGVLSEDGTCDFARYTIPEGVEVEMDLDGAKV